MRIDLFESIFREADKSRFIIKAVNAVKADPEISAFLDVDDTIERLTKFANSGAADKYKINWQEKDGIKLYQQIDDAYTSWTSKGGSIKNQKLQKKQDPKKIFLDSGLRVVNENDNPSNADLVFLNSLENDDFLFVIPMTWMACVFIDSFKCGGQGARWCIGHEQDSSYWNKYIQFSIFILAFNKREFANPSNEVDKLKYMIQLADKESDTQAWKQSDIASETIKPNRFKDFFGYDPNELLAKAYLAIYKDDADTEYSNNNLSNLNIKDGKINYYGPKSAPTMLQLKNLVGKSEDEISDYLKNIFEKIIDKNEPLIIYGEKDKYWDKYWGFKATNNSLSQLESFNVVSEDDIEFDLGRFLYLLAAYDEYGATNKIIFRDVNVGNLLIFTDDDYLRRDGVKLNVNIPRSIRTITFEKFESTNIEISESYLKSYLARPIFNFANSASVSGQNGAVCIDFVEDPDFISNISQSDKSATLKDLWVYNYDNLVIFKNPIANDIKDGESLDHYFRRRQIKNEHKIFDRILRLEA